MVFVLRQRLVAITGILAKNVKNAKIKKRLDFLKISLLLRVDEFIRRDCNIKGLLSHRQKIYKNSHLFRVDNLIVTILL